MKIENQVCTLEQAKRLAELLGEGMPSPTWYWIFDSSMKWQLFPKDYCDLEAEGIDYYPAYTVAELGLMLMEHDDDYAFSSFYDSHMGFYCCDARKRDEDHTDGFRPLENIVEADTEAQARAQLLIYLLEEGMYDAEICHKLLTD